MTLRTPQISKLNKGKKAFETNPTKEAEKRPLLNIFPDLTMIIANYTRMTGFKCLKTIQLMCIQFA